MGIIPVNVDWEVEISTPRWHKLITDIIIFRRVEGEPDKIKQLVMTENSHPNNGTKWEIKEVPIDTINALPTLQLPREVLEPLAKALHGMGIDGGSGSKLAGKVEAQTEHLKDLRQIVLSFIDSKNTKPKEEQK